MILISLDLPFAFSSSYLLLHFAISDSDHCFKQGEKTAAIITIFIRVYQTSRSLLVHVKAQCMSAIYGLFIPKETTVESSVYSSKEGSNNYHLHHQNLDCLGIPQLRLKTVYDFKKFGTVSSIFMVKYMDKQQPVIYA